MKVAASSKKSTKAATRLENMRKISGNAINVYVGQRIKLRRRSLGYTLDDISIRTGISVQMWSNYELGKSQIPPYALLVISLTLSISVDLLFPENPNSLSNQQTSKPGIILAASNPNIGSDLESDLFYKKETVDLIEAFYRLPTQDLRRAIRAMMRTIAAELPRANVR